jgi:hypothetical protein
MFGAYSIRTFRLEEEAQAEAQEKASVCERKEMEWKKRRLAEKKRSEIPLLEFTRQVVDSLFRKQSDPNKTIVPQQEAILKDSALPEVRFDSGRHLVIGSKVKGVCKQCKARSKFRCLRCKVALHPEHCFYKYHTHEDEWEDVFM